MFYYLFDLLKDTGFPGARLMDYITFRSGAALILSLFIAMVFGRRIIDRLQKMQVGEIVRNLGLEGQMKKTGTPTMGGIIIIVATLVPCLLVGNLTNIYMILMLVSVVWLGSLGFADDWLKMRRHNKDGMSGKTMAEPVSSETVAEPLATDNSSEIRNGMNTAGSGVSEIRLPR